MRFILLYFKKQTNYFYSIILFKKNTTNIKNGAFTQNKKDFTRSLFCRKSLERARGLPFPKGDRCFYFFFKYLTESKAQAAMIMIPLRIN